MRDVRKRKAERRRHTYAMDLRQSSESPDPPSLCDDASRSIWRVRMTKSAQLMIPSPFMSIRRSNPESDLRSPIFLLNSFASAASDLPSPLDGDPSPGPFPTRGGEQCLTCRLAGRKLPICGTRLDILHLRDIHSRVIGASVAGAREKTGRVFFRSPFPCQELRRADKNVRPTFRYVPSSG